MILVLATRYAVCTSTPSLNPMMPKMQNNLDKEEVNIEEDDSFPYPSLNWYLSLSLILL